MTTDLPSSSTTPPVAYLKELDIAHLAPYVRRLHWIVSSRVACRHQNEPARCGPYALPDGKLERYVVSGSQALREANPSEDPGPRSGLHRHR